MVWMCFKFCFNYPHANTTCFIIPNALHQIALTVSTVCVSFCRNHFGLQHSGKCTVLPGGPLVSPLLPSIIQLLMERRNPKKLITCMGHPGTTWNKTLYDLRLSSLLYLALGDAYIPVRKCVYMHLHLWYTMCAHLKMYKHKAYIYIYSIIYTSTYI